MLSFCGAVLLVLHTVSMHETAGFNNFNYGAGLECRTDYNIVLSSGVYENSYNLTTIYAIAGYEPIKLLNDKIVIGAFTGYASGYGLTDIIAGFRVRSSVTEHIEFGVMVIPTTHFNTGVYHLTTSWKF